MSTLVKEKAHEVINLFPRPEAVRIIIRLMDNDGNRTESVILEITGAGIMSGDLVVQTHNGKNEYTSFPLENIFDLDAPNHWLSKS